VPTPPIKIPERPGATGVGVPAAPGRLSLVCSHKYYFEVIWDPENRWLKGFEVVEGRPGLTDVGPDGPEPSS
jgi:hypothetical protein